MRWQDLISSATLVLLAAVITTSGSPARIKRDEEDAGEGRVLASFVFPFFPQYQGVNYGETLEFLTRSDTIGYFVIRDVITYFAAVGAWALIHTALWDGKAERTEDLPFPFNVMALLFGGDSAVTTLALSKSSSSQSSNSRIDEDAFQTDFDGVKTTEMEKLYYAEEVDTVQEKLNGMSLGSISLNGLYNFLTRPKTSAFNLVLALGFSAFGMMVWMAPTFLWSGVERPETDVAFVEDVKRRGDVGAQINHRFGKVVQDLGNDADLIKTYNRLFCANCVARLATIYGVGLVGKLIWWGVISLLPKDWPDIFFNNNGLTVENKRSFADSSYEKYYDPRLHSYQRNLQEMALRILEDIDDKIEKVNKGIL